MSYTIVSEGLYRKFISDTKRPWLVNIDHTSYEKERGGFKHSWVIRSTVHVPKGMCGAISEWAIAHFLNADGSKLDSLGNCRSFYSKDLSLKISSINSTFVSVVVDTVDKDRDLGLRKLDECVSEFGIVTHFANDCYDARWNEIVSRRRTSTC